MMKGMRGGRRVVRVEEDPILLLLLDIDLVLILIRLSSSPFPSPSFLRPFQSRSPLYIVYCSQSWVKIIASSFNQYYYSLQIPLIFQCNWWLLSSLFIYCLHRHLDKRSSHCNQSIVWATRYSRDFIYWIALVHHFISSSSDGETRQSSLRWKKGTIRNVLLCFCLDLVCSHN